MKTVTRILSLPIKYASSNLQVARNWKVRADELSEGILRSSYARWEFSHGEIARNARNNINTWIVPNRELFPTANPTVLYFQQGDSYDEFRGMLISVLTVRDSNILFIRAMHILADFYNCSLFFLHDLVGSSVEVVQGKHGILITCRTNTLPFNSWAVYSTACFSDGRIALYPEALWLESRTAMSEFKQDAEATLGEAVVKQFEWAI